MTRRATALALCALLFPAGNLGAADGQQAEGSTLPTPAQRAISEMRRLAACAVEPADDSGQAYAYRGRMSLEIKGRPRGGDAAGTLRDRAVFDPSVGRIVSYICFANASARTSGEAIVSLAEVSGRGDALVRTILARSNLELESIKRYRGRTESVYYEARYASASGEFPFLEPPVRLLLNATTGALFRLDIDPDWIDPAKPPRSRITRQAAEQIATEFLRSHELANTFGSGAVPTTVAGAELFTVKPNDWLGASEKPFEARARVAWVVPFRIDGVAETGLHALFVDAATGAALGGLPAQSGARQSR